MFRIDMASSPLHPVHTRSHFNGHPCPCKSKRNNWIPPKGQSWHQIKTTALVIILWQFNGFQYNFDSPRKTGTTKVYAKRCDILIISCYKTLIDSWTKLSTFITLSHFITFIYWLIFSFLQATFNMFLKNLLKTIKRQKYNLEL